LSIEFNPIADLRVHFLDNVGVVFDAKPYPFAALTNLGEPLSFQTAPDQASCAGVH
jgi:hypothetical protein